MSDLTDRLDAIQRVLDVRISPGPNDVNFLLDLARKQQAALEAVLKRAKAWEDAYHQDGTGPGRIVADDFRSAIQQVLEAKP
jgi:hypothetical protein